MVSTRSLLLLLLLSASLEAFSQISFNWVNTLGAGTRAHAMVRTNAGDLFVGGFFSGSQADLDPGPDTFLVNAPTTVHNYFVSKWDPNGQMQWVRTFKKGFNSKLSAIQADAQGNMLVAGFFGDSIRFENGQHFYSKGGFDAYLAKYSPIGDLLWVHTFGSPFAEEANTLLIDPDGNLLLGGKFSGTVDFDPAPGAEHLETGVQLGQAFVLKLDADGQFVWVRSWDGAGSGYRSWCQSLALDQEQHLLMTGTFYEDIDFDPGPGTQVSTAIIANAIILKMDLDGNLVWAKTLSGSSNEFGMSIVSDPKNNILLAGEFFNILDADPGPGVFSMTCGSNRDVFILKLTQNGDFVWATQNKGDGLGKVVSIQTDFDGNVYTTGTFDSYEDFDPGPDNFYMFSTGTFNDKTDIFVQKLSDAGRLIQVFQLGGTSDDFVYDMHVYPNDELLLCGRVSNQVDFDPGPTQQLITLAPSGSAFFLLTSQNWKYEGVVFQDLNNNAIQDADEPGLRGVLVGAREHETVAETNSEGVFRLYQDLSEDTILLAQPKPYWTVTPVSLAADTSQTGYNFAVSIPSVKDVCLTAVEFVSFQRGFPSTVHIQVVNAGSLPLDSIPVRLRITSQTDQNPISFEGAVPPYIFEENNEVRWLVDHLEPGEKTVILLRIKTAANSVLGEEVRISASAILDDDADPFNNGSRIVGNIFGSHDPNDKKVTPATVEPTMLDTTEFRYVIRFQNTGNFPASFVVIRDTLPNSLDISTLNVFAASHPYTWRIINPRVLEFYFDPINLPDSTSNEPESHGFAAFTIRTKPGLSLGDSVVNRAGIYFDFNEPVITDYSVMKVTVASSVHSPWEADELNFSLTPNPVSNESSVRIETPYEEITVELYDQMGHRLRMSNSKIVSLNGLPAGAYFIQVRAEGRVGGKVLVIK
ncbi:MAG: T9SS type A sorting domain-containing protein [Saprospiraceae bacterium]|nr:T9SS type A sorting domain-containing protein [Saprospiraceae bacterium]